MAKKLTNDIEIVKRNQPKFSVMEKSFGTLSQTIEGLKKEGYTMDFNMNQECLTCHKTNTVLSPDEFEIDAVYRFEGESNPMMKPLFMPSLLPNMDRREFW